MKLSAQNRNDGEPSPGSPRLEDGRSKEVNKSSMGGPEDPSNDGSIALEEDVESHNAVEDSGATSWFYSSAASQQSPSSLSFWHLFAMQTTFNTTSVVIIMPSAIGLLGYVAGPILLCLYVLLSYSVCAFLVDIVGQSRSNKNNNSSSSNNSRIKSRTRNGSTSDATLGDVGHDLAGPTGRIVFRFVQVLNLALFMPVVLNLQAGAWQFVFFNDDNEQSSSWATCIGYWELICFAILIVSLLLVLRRWKEAAWVSAISVALASIKALALLPYGYVEYQEDIVTSVNYLGQPVAFGAPSGYNTWTSIGTGISYICYGYAPVFILAETMAECSSAKVYKKSLAWSSLYQVCLYLVASLMAVVYWGWNLPAPITDIFPTDSALGIALNVIVALSAFVDYVLASLVVDSAIQMWIQHWWLSSSSTSTTSSKWFRWLLNRVLPILVPSGFALVLALVVPQLSSLIGIVTGFTILGMNLYIPSLAWIFGSRRSRNKQQREQAEAKAFVELAGNEDNDVKHGENDKGSANDDAADDNISDDYTRNAVTMNVGKGRACTLYTALVIGIPLSALVIAVAFYDISLTDFSTNAFCQG